MKSLLGVINEYDCEQRSYIEQLETENEILRQKYSDAISQLASYIVTVDRMKLDLILAGAIRIPAAER